MARFNEILVARFNRGLTKFLGMKGPEPAPQIASEINTTFMIRLMQDFEFLEGWNRYGVTVSNGPVAGQVGRVELRNPPGSGVLAVVERAMGSTSPAVNMSLVYSTTLSDLVGSQSVVQLDARQTNPQSSLHVSLDTAAAPFGNQFLKAAAQILYDFIQNERQQILLAPSASIVLQSDTVNQNLQASFTWRERPIEESEKVQ